MESIKKTVESVLNKIKTNKKAQIVLAVLILIIVLVVFFTQSGIIKTNTKETTVTVVETCMEDGVERWEKRLSAVLSEMDGVGKADVMITVSATNEKVTANTTSTNVTTSENTSGNTSSSTHTTVSPVIVSSSGKSEPYIVKEKMPDIIGVVVVAKGAENSMTKLAILRAVQTALNVPASRVEIYPMN